MYNLSNQNKAKKRQTVGSTRRSNAKYLVTPPTIELPQKPTNFISDKSVSPI